jgi:DNA (cytosine-5)-methyltransferase 1
VLLVGLRYAMTNLPSSDASAIPVIDLFAGPGGLGEGFDGFRASGKRQFDVRLSIEKEPVACATLLIRNFLRQFETPPEELLAYFSGQATLAEAFAAHQQEAEAARSTVWNAELGKASARSVAHTVRTRLRGYRDWILLGGPPCQAYSIAGRSRMRTTRPDFDQDERHLLYREYLRIVADHEPAVFVLENVKGLLTSKHGGEKIVTRILDDLSNPAKALGTPRGEGRSYRLYELGQRQAPLPWVEDDRPDGENFLVRAEEFGVPQMRHRVFIVGVRTDISGRPAPLRRMPEVSVSDVLSDLPQIRSALSREGDSLDQWRSAVIDIRDQAWMSASDPLLSPVTREVRRVITRLLHTEFDTGATYLTHRSAPKALADWYRHNAVGGLTHHESRAHMRSDLHRYMFAACFAHAHARSPELQDFPKELRPAHKNVSQAVDGGDMFNDRFRVQLRNRPSTTITSHISKDGHYYIHYDPLQCRSLTVREAARLQTFPDNYFFAGNRTQQYHQIGNAVPPLLAAEIARVIHDLLVAANRLGSPSLAPATRENRTSRSGGRGVTNITIA